MATYPGFSTSTPGFTDVRQSVENDAFFQSNYLNDPVYDPLGLVDSGATDVGHTNATAQLRVGLVMAKITSSGKWTAYSASANDGSQIACGILAKETYMTDPTTGTARDRQSIIATCGNVKAANGNKLIGLDAQARYQLRNAGFVFDDASTNPTPSAPFVGERTVTGTGALTSADNGKLIVVNSSALTTITLPAIAVGLVMEVVNVVDQTLAIASAEGTNIVVVNNASASSLTFSTSSMKIGARVKFVAAYAGATLKWFAEVRGTGGTQTVTIA